MTPILSPLASRPTLIANMTPAEAERKRAGDRINQRWSRARKQGKIIELEHENSALRVQNERLQTQLAEAEKQLRQLRESYEALGTTINASHALLHRENSNPARYIRSMPAMIASIASEACDTAQTSTDVVVTPCSSLTSASPSSAISTSVDPATNISFDLPLEFGTGVVVNLFNDQSLGTEYLPWATNEDFIHDSSVTWADSCDTAAHASLDINFHLNSRLAPLNFDVAPAWQLLPIHVPPTTALDRVLIEVAESGRQWSQQKGRHHEELSRGNFPSLSSLLKPDLGDAAAHPIATAVGKHTTWGTTVVAFPSRVAYHYIVAHMVRWFVCRTQESYEQLPEFLKPTALQLTVPHPAWIDLFPW
jgi:hypothetical protein